MFYIKTAMGKLEPMGRKRKSAQEKADKEFGKGKYRVFETSPDYDHRIALMKG